MKRDMRESRDVELGAMLETLDAPVVSEEFFLRLRRSLLDPGWRTAPQSLMPRPSATKGRSRVRLIFGTAVLTLILAVPSGFLLGTSVNADPGTDPVNAVMSFTATPGWNTVTTTFGPAGQKLSVAWAANVPFASEHDYSGFPSDTIRALPQDGIVLTAIGPRSYTGGETFPEMREPLDLSQGSCAWDQYEGQPAPNVSKCLIDTMVGNRLFNVMVWFGSIDPSEEMIAQANQQLSHVTIPGS